MDRAMIQIYTGDGKGKTSAASGLSLRALSRGLRVLFADFTSGTPEGAPSSMMGLEGFELMTFPLIGSAGEDALQKLAGAMKDRDLVILDGFCSLLKHGVLGEEEAREFIVSRPVGVEMVLTGEGAPGWLMEMAGLVTEMKDLKPQSQKGVKAGNGIQY
jgi:cob(I)alamin adenosyltransferase